MGEDPRVRGFFHGVGFNSAGMMLGGGCGDQLAKWIVRGRPELDMYGYDIRRFCPEVSSDKVWVDERSHEAYAKNYAMVFPHDEPLAGRNMKTDPFHSILLAAGCVYQERFGWERPGWFTMHGPCPLKKYDWYGAYGNLPNTEYGYKERLNLDYTFDHTPIEENVSSLSLRVSCDIVTCSDPCGVSGHQDGCCSVQHVLLRQVLPDGARGSAGGGLDLLCQDGRRGRQDCLHLHAQ